MATTSPITEQHQIQPDQQTTQTRGYSPELCQRILELHGDGLGAFAISKRLHGTTTRGIKRWLQKRNLRIKNADHHGRRDGNLTPETIEQIMALHAKGYGVGSIERTLQLNKNTLYRFIKQRGLRTTNTPEINLHLQEAKEKSTKRKLTESIRLTKAMHEMTAFRNCTSVGDYLAQLAQVDHVTLQSFWSLDGVPRISPRDYAQAYFLLQLPIHERPAVRAEIMAIEKKHQEANQ